MNFLEERIIKDGIVKEGNVLKVDSFLNHQMDIALFDQIGKEFKRRFAKEKINKIVTIEASGIGIACIVARHFNVPVVFAKKSKSINIEGEMYVAEVESFTHKCKNQVIVSKKFLNPDTFDRSTSLIYNRNESLKCTSVCEEIINYKNVVLWI